MRYSILLSAVFMFFSNVVSAEWHKINDADYIWGPFKIYNLSLFSETGEYTPDTRPLMLTLKYEKPVDGRDFAISLARSWSNLGITLPEQEAVVDRLRKTIPDIKKDDSLSYIALADKGYFVLNDVIIPEEFNQDFNDAVLAIWLDPRVEIGRKLLNKPIESAVANTQTPTEPIAATTETVTQAPVAPPTEGVEPPLSPIAEPAPTPAETDKPLTQEQSEAPAPKTEVVKEEEKAAPVAPVEQKESGSQEQQEESKEVLPPADPILPTERPAT